MKNRIVKKILRIILLVLVGAAVIGTFYFLWKKRNRSSPFMRS